VELLLCTGNAEGHAVLRIKQIVFKWVDAEVISRVSIIFLVLKNVEL